MPTSRTGLLETIPDAIAIVSPTGQVLTTNEAFRALGAVHSLVALFGSEVHEWLIAAKTDAVDVRLPAPGTGDPHRWFRLSLRRQPDGEALVAHLVDVSEEERLRGRAEQFDREIHLLREMGSALSGSIELDAITNRIGELVSRLAQTRNFYVALYDRQTRTVSFPRYIEEGTWQSEVQRPFGNGLTEYVLSTAAPLLLNRDVRERARVLGIEPVGRESSAWLGVPMVANGEALGVIAIQEYERTDCYDRHHLEVLSIIASQAAAAIKHAILLEASRRAYQELSETQARLLESERIRGITEAVGAMNHEVNNPLAAIVGSAQLLKRHHAHMGDEALAKVQAILDAARRIQEVTGKMSSLIQASSMPYPGESDILDLRRSVAAGDTCELPPTKGA